VVDQGMQVGWDDAVLTQVHQVLQCDEARDAFQVSRIKLQTQVTMSLQSYINGNFNKTLVS